MVHVPSHKGRLTHQILSSGPRSDGGAGHACMVYMHSTLQILSSDRRNGGKGHSGNKDGGSQGWRYLIVEFVVEEAITIYNHLSFLEIKIWTILRVHEVFIKKWSDF